MDSRESKGLKTSVDILEEYFGSRLGPSEIEAIRNSRKPDLLRLLGRLEEFYNSRIETPGRKPQECRVFPSMFNYRDIGTFLHKHMSPEDTDDETRYWLYLKHLELQSEILKLLLYYDSVVIADPVSHSYIQDYAMKKKDYDPDMVSASLANAVELLVPLSSFIRERAVILYPKWSALMRMGSTLQADQLECEDPDFQKLCHKYNIRKKPQKPILFVGGTLEMFSILDKFAEANLPESQMRLYTSLINSYMFFAAEMGADFVAQNRWTWDVLRYKMSRVCDQYPVSTAASIPAAMECINVVNFDDISTDDLRALRKNEEAFATWRADLSSAIAISDPSDKNFEEMVRRLNILSSDILPRRAVEIETAIKKTSLTQYLSDAAFAFSAAGLAGLGKGDLEKVLVESTATSAASLLLSILFRRTPTEQRILASLYTMLAKKEKDTGWIKYM